MEKIQLEFILGQISELSLWKMLSTGEGLSRWFSDSVGISGNVYLFTWNGADETATLLGIKEKEYIRFRWERKGDDTYFELAIDRNPLTRDLVLKITDFEEESERASEIHLLGTQVERLKRLLGVL